MRCVPVPLSLTSSYHSILNMSTCYIAQRETSLGTAISPAVLLLAATAGSISYQSNFVPGRQLPGYYVNSTVDQAEFKRRGQLFLSRCVAVDWQRTVNGCRPARRSEARRYNCEARASRPRPSGRRSRKVAAERLHSNSPAISQQVAHNPRLSAG